jgi:hypothetical protein
MPGRSAAGWRRYGAEDLLKRIVRTQASYWQIVGRYFGAIVSIEFLRVSNQGWDIYQVQHENDVHQYRIALGDEGKVYGFSEASATADKQALV